jgi:hypothetical protein
MARIAEKVGLPELPGESEFMTRGTGTVFALALSLLAIEPAVGTSTAAAQGKFVVEPVTETKLKQLPEGPLYWRIDNFETLAAAKAAAGPTALAAEIAGKVWLFTLGPKGGSSAGASKVAEIGPVPPIAAPEVSVAHQPRRRPARHQDGNAQSSGVGSVLCARRPHEPAHVARHGPSRRGPIGAGSRSGYADGSRQQRRDRPGSARHVRGRCDAAVLLASQIRLTTSGERKPSGRLQVRFHRRRFAAEAGVRFSQCVSQR